MPQFQVVNQRTFVRGVNASTDLFDVPKGSVPRISNMLMTRRGSFKTCDGTAIVYAFNNTPTADRGKLLAGILYQPIGVPSYYVVIGKALDLPLGRPQNLTAAATAGGTLAAGTYFYYVTAIDGVGGDTIINSGTVSVALSGGNGSATLTWNIVPNAVGYNIYRGTTAGGEAQIQLAVPQPNPGALTVTAIDTGFPLVSVTPMAISVIQTNITNIMIDLVNPLAEGIFVGESIVVAGVTSTVNFNATYTALGTYPVGATQIVVNNPNSLGGGNQGTGGTLTIDNLPPSADTTQQTALFVMPIGSASYNNSNIAALWPADFNLPAPPPGRGGGGSGSGGGGTGGSGSAPSSPGGTLSGGLPPGNVNLIPEILQFTNRLVIALGNGYPAQLFSDSSGTPDNPAASVPITAISVDAFGVVTVTAAGHGLVAGQEWANVIIAGVANPLYDQVGPVLNIISSSQFKIRNLAVASFAASSGGTVTITTVPFISSFTAGYPIWITGQTYLVGDIITPTTPNGHIYKCTQAGITGASEPAFPTGAGQRVSDGTATWQEAGPLNSGSPPPPAAAHIEVFAGSLWVFDTSSINATDGIDGPCSLRMSDSNNVNSWNPINQAFLDKDAGTEGMGLASFTITAQGIPPEGSLVAFKYYATYQIIGVFGASDFAIQRVKSNMGCIAPRTIQFLPGFGIARYTHLGIAVFDGVEDKLISEDIRPYLFPSNDLGYSDIQPVDANYVGLSWAAQTANPPMYVLACPIGNSQGMLTRIFCYDLVLKAWTICDLPFPISTLFQAFSTVSNPLTLLGSFSDGTLQRWQATDLQWATATVANPAPGAVAWTMRSPDIYNEQGSPAGLTYIHQIIVRGRINDPVNGSISAAFDLQNEGTIQANGTLYMIGSNGAFEFVVPLGEKVINAKVILSGTSSVEIDSIGWFIKPESTTIPVRAT